MTETEWKGGRGLNITGEIYPSAEWHIMDPFGNGTICGRWFPYGTEHWEGQLPRQTGEVWRKNGWHRLGPDGWCWSCQNEYRKRVARSQAT